MPHLGEKSRSRRRAVAGWRTTLDLTISEDPTDDYDFFVVGSWRKPVHRLLEEAIRIRIAKTRGIQDS